MSLSNLGLLFHEYKIIGSLIINLIINTPLKKTITWGEKSSIERQNHESTSKIPQPVYCVDVKVIAYS